MTEAPALEMFGGDPDEAPEALDAAQIMALLPHRHPFILVDRVEGVVPGHHATAIKAVTATEPWFTGHFPGNPIFPGVLLAEAFAQVAALVALTANRHLVGRPVLLIGLDKVRFRRPVVPGDRVVMRATRQWIRLGIWGFSAEAEIDGERVASADLSATLMGRDGQPIPLRGGGSAEARDAAPRGTVDPDDRT
jgi:3-hydroxyacyl-[acyl-carrier-protein] dehydratase